jgi:hypothetical protein
MTIKDEWTKFPNLFNVENDQIRDLFLKILNGFYNNGLTDGISGGVLEELYYQYKIEKTLNLPFHKFLKYCYEMEILLPNIGSDEMSKDLNLNTWYINPKIVRQIKIKDILDGSQE